MIGRRDFLATLVALGGSKALPDLATRLGSSSDKGAFPDGNRNSVNPVILRSKSLTVTLDETIGLPLRYELRGIPLRGEDVGIPIAAILCQLHPRMYSTIHLQVASVRRSLNTAIFTFEARLYNSPAVKFSLRYLVNETRLTLTMEDVVEHPGFELIEVALPNLVTVRESDRSAWLAQGRDGGSFVRLAAAKPYQYEDDDNFGRISIQLPMGAVGTEGIGCLMEVTAFMDGTETSILEIAGARRGYIGTIKVHRVHGGRCYNMNDGGDAVCGNGDTPNLLVGQPSQCHFDFYEVKDPGVPWFPAATLLRDRMPKSPTNYFDNKFLYMIGGKIKTEPIPRATFQQSKQLMQDIARLTDYAPQVAYISGWVYDGQDTGYPSEDVVNSSLGTYEELMHLMDSQRRLNVNVSVNVNYDDAYKSSPQFDPDFIAREPNSTIWKSRAWDGEDSYIVGMAKFVLGGWAIRRINSTMARYKLRDAMLIDALSWFTIRNDWDRTHPASGYRNLVDGKWVIINEFRKHGVNICSEQFRYPMVGKLALSVDGPEPKPCPFGGDQIPLTAIVYRKSTIFGGSGGGTLRAQQDLFWNSRPGVWYEHKTDRKTITDYYYLVVLPYNKVHTLDVESYSTSGSQRTLHLQSQSRVTMDNAASNYEVLWNSTTIAKDETTTCPIDEVRVAFYSRAGGELTYPIPAHWNDADVIARSLYVDKTLSHPVRIEAGRIKVDVPARVPVMVYGADRYIPMPGDSHATE